jgi:spermidine/putrescine transport system permease protein
MAKVFGKWSAPIMLLMVLPLFVSENVRLFGWVIFLMKGGGIFAGTMKTLFGLDPGSILYQASAVLLGLCYVYLPFMLFPMMLGVSMVPKDVVESASDLGANRWQIFREVELPLAMPGVLVGGLLTFILAVGAISEATILGGQNALVVAIEIRHLFTYAQNWPMGSSVAMLVTLFTAILVVAVLSRLNLDRLLGKR